MATNNPLTANDFSFFYSHSFGYEKRKEPCPDYQVENPDITVGAVLLTYQPNS